MKPSAGRSWSEDIIPGSIGQDVRAYNASCSNAYFACYMSAIRALPSWQHVYVDLDLADVQTHAAFVLKFTADVQGRQGRSVTYGP